MTIEEITIENYLCYYGRKKLEFSTGLNIILGENGEGKTKFFEAVDWLFRGNAPQLEQLVSAKKLAEVAEGESFRVGVTLVAEQHREQRTLTRQFSVTKTGPNACEVSRAVLEGIEENSAGERSPVDGTGLLERLFPATVRRYSLFKGETALNIFDQSETLITLIHAFSDARHFDRYEQRGKYLSTEAQQAVDAFSRQAVRNQAEYTKLESVIRSLQEECSREKTFLKATQAEIYKLKEHIADVANYVTNADALETVNQRITEHRRRIEATEARIRGDFTTALLDEKWILMGFEKIQQQFAAKINALSTERRRLQSEHDRAEGIRIGERRAKAELLNQAIPLPVTVPSKAVMEEMLRDHICKVCNTEAPEDSAPYKFMAQRLQEYLESQRVEEEPAEAPPLFAHDYTTRLVHLNSSHEDNLSAVREIPGEIKDLFELNEKLRKDVLKYRAEMEKEIEERTRILGNSSLSEEGLQQALKNYNGWQNKLLSDQQTESRYLAKVAELEAQLQDKREKKNRIDRETANTFLLKTRDILQDVYTIFKETRATKFQEFVSQLEDLANDFLTRINITAFRGRIAFHLDLDAKNPKVKIELQEGDQQTVHSPNQSLVTSMHIAVLLAISQLAAAKNEENYPMIFDAPTSSFGENKTGTFLNLMSGMDAQIILLTKDFVVKNDETGTIEVKPEFAGIQRQRANWVRLERPFDPEKLKTINTEIIAL